MKHFKNNEQSAQTDKGIYQYLQTIKQMVKTPELRELGFQKLNEIDPDELNSSLHVLYLYIKCRYYYFTYKDKGNLVNLHSADTWADEMIRTASGKVEISSKRYFVRAYYKYLLSKYALREKSREFYLQKVKTLTEASFRRFPNNPSFNWLKGEL